MSNSDLKKRLREDPALFARKVLGIEPWDAQLRIAESVRDNAETAVKSCHAAGKDWTAAFVALHFLFNHKPSLVITTAPTDRQVRSILWKEIGTMHARARWPLGGELLTQRLEIDRDWLALGFAAPDYDPDKFQGYHSDNILVILDEAAGISSDIYDAVDSVLAGGHARKLEIGNPTDGTARFAKSFKSTSVSKITISAFDTPNFTAFGITEHDIASGAWETKVGENALPHPYLINPAWAAKMFERHGPSSVFYKSRVKAEFPAAGKDTLIPLTWIEAAQQRSLDKGVPHVLSLDVGRGGDPSIIGERWGGYYRRRQRIDARDTMAVTGHLMTALGQSGASEARIDVIGVGAGTYDRAKEQGAPVVEACAGSGSYEPERYLNARAEWGWGLREMFEQGEIDIDPYDDDLASQLAEIRWKPDSRGRVTLEPKEETKKRLGRSPDDFDAMMIAFGRMEQALVLAGPSPSTGRSKWA